MLCWLVVERGLFWYHFNYYALYSIHFDAYFNLRHACATTSASPGAHVFGTIAQLSQLWRRLICTDLGQLFSRTSRCEQGHIPAGYNNNICPGDS